MLCLTLSTRPSVYYMVRIKFRSDCKGVDEENNEMVRQVLHPWPIILPRHTKQYASFCCFFHATSAKSIRDGVSHETVGREISSSKAEDSQEWNYQGQFKAGDHALPPARVCHYQPLPQTQALVDLAKDISDLPLQMTKIRSSTFHQRRMMSSQRL